MSPFQLVRKMISSLLFLNIVSRYKGKPALMKIKAAQVYVAGVKKIRILFLGILLAIFSFVLLGSGLSLIHSGLFTYSLWSSQMKFIAALALGGVEFLGAVIILFYLFREETWSKFTEIPKVVDSVVDGKKAKNKF